MIDKSLKCTKLKWFQLRLVNRILATNKSVSKYSTSQSPMCTFCSLTEETISHLFYDCQFIKQFWQKLENEIQTKCQTWSKITKLSKELILFGYSQNIISNSVFDKIIVLAKHYIYKQKVKGESLRFEVFLKELENEYKADKYIARVTHKESHFNLEWTNLLSLIKT